MAHFRFERRNDWRACHTLVSVDGTPVGNDGDVTVSVYVTWSQYARNIVGSAGPARQVAVAMFHYERLGFGDRHIIELEGVPWRHDRNAPGDYWQDVETVLKDKLDGVLRKEALLMEQTMEAKKKSLASLINAMEESYVEARRILRFGELQEKDEDE